MIFFNVLGHQSFIFVQQRFVKNPFSLGYENTQNSMYRIYPYETIKYNLCFLFV